MNVAVMSRSQAKRFTFQPHGLKIAIISITDPDKPYATFDWDHSKNEIKLVAMFSFWDEEKDEHGCISESDAVKIAEAAIAAQDMKVDLLIVHCEAGISRSAGVAGAILKAFTGDDTQVFGDPRYSPNMTCYRRVLNALNEMNL
jgi:predicted protein tyrosine phosphatase